MSSEEIAKEIVVAWLTQCDLKAVNQGRAAEAAKMVGEFYKTVHKAVQESMLAK